MPANPLLPPYPVDPAAMTEPLGIDAATVAILLGISLSHFFGLLRTDRFGPEARRMGRAKRYDRAEVVRWFHAGCPSRSRWQAMKGGANVPQ